MRFLGESIGPIYDGYQLGDAAINGTDRKLYTTVTSLLGGIVGGSLAKGVLIGVTGVAVVTPAGWAVIIGGSVLSGTLASAGAGVLYDWAHPPCFPNGTSITSDCKSLVAIECVNIGAKVAVVDSTSTGTVTQIFRNITTEWLDVVWTRPETGEIEQIVSTLGHRFLKLDSEYKHIVDMVD